jgi:hypothetical protein
MSPLAWPFVAAMMLVRFAVAVGLWITHGLYLTVLFTVGLVTGGFLAHRGRLKVRLR